MCEILFIKKKIYWQILKNVLYQLPETEYTQSIGFTKLYYLSVSISSAFYTKGVF